MEIIAWIFSISLWVLCGIGLFYFWYKSESRHLKLIGIKDDCCRNEYNLTKIEPFTLQCKYCKRVFHYIDKRTGKQPMLEKVE